MQPSPSTARPLGLTWRGLLVALTTLAATAGPALAQRPAQQTPQPERPVYPPTPIPKDLPDEDEDEDEEEEEEQAPAVIEATATPAPPGFVLPARTRRPTRTPRATALPSPSPLAAGGLRLTISASPSVLVLRQPAAFTLELVNLGLSDVAGVVIDVVTPDVLIDFDAEARVGELSQAGGLLSWYLPSFGRGQRASLRIAGPIARAGGERTGLCATLVSSGAAIEHCAAFEVRSSLGPEGTAPATGEAEAPATPALAPTGGAALRDEGRPGALLGFGLLLAGLAVLGGWLGRARLAPRRGPAPEPAPVADAPPATPDDGAAPAPPAPRAAGRTKGPRRKSP